MSDLLAQIDEFALPEPITIEWAGEDHSKVLVKFHWLNVRFLIFLWFGNHYRVENLISCRSIKTHDREALEAIKYTYIISKGSIGLTELKAELMRINVAIRVRAAEHNNNIKGDP